ncbi:archaeosine tRNA-ribosyltransferase [Methanobrevibacter boviskoreani]|jgi:predicted RNA-binding protein|uniref:archaeosine tRNA-ribosyltransferase n=1 Tax=Methanobrevibacter boviskoreani TaxID=1348249 RepID=UPI0005949550|nr:archaeosine tRNA-ribosyltransferase [Methanobrevibacter boviskoreani]
MPIKFEIKSHDGPGRFGKLNGEKTPLLIDSEKYPIAEDQSCPYNVDRELAEWSVRETIKKSSQKGMTDNCPIAVIQGSKYLDLRLECSRKLEELGYNGFLIANGDELLLHPQDLVELIVNLRENLNPNSYLIFPFAECSFMPLLSYMGIDGYLIDSSKYYSYLNVLMTPTKNYDLNTYKIYEDMEQDEIEKYNRNTLDLVIREIRWHMKNRSLRNLVEERANTSPQNKSALKILDKNYMDYLLKYNQLF